MGARAPAPVLTKDLLRRLLATCAGRGFEARRDRALILLLLDSGGVAPRSPACGWAM